MKEKAKKEKILKPLNVDEITIRRDRYFANAYTIDVPLDSIPDHDWQDIFELKWKSSRHLWDRKLFVIGDKLRLVTTANEFGEKLNWVGQVVKETNNAIDEYNRAVQKEKEKRKEEIDKEALEEKAKVEVFRDILRSRFG